MQIWSFVSSQILSSKSCEQGPWGHKTVSDCLTGSYIFDLYRLKLGILKFCDIYLYHMIMRIMQNRGHERFNGPYSIVVKGKYKAIHNVVTRLFIVIWGWKFGNKHLDLEVTEPRLH